MKIYILTLHPFEILIHIISNSMKPSFLAGMLLSFGSARKYWDEPSYDFDLKLSFPGADYDSLFRSDGKFKSAKRAEFGAIRGAQDNILSATRTIDSLFLRLPSEFELNQLILSADSVAILKTIQTVATDDSIPCDKRIAYLLEVLGKLRKAIEEKIFAADQIKVIIDGAKEEIRRLEKEIERLQAEKKALWLDELRDKLAKLVKELQETYNKFNATEEEIAPREGKIAGYEKEISILQKSSDAERNRIAQEKLKLTETQAILRELETQLKNAKNRKESLEHSIKKSENIIASNDKRVAEARAQIRRIEKEIAKLQDLADKLRGKYTALEIKVERLRTDISVAEAKEDKINAEIDHNIDRINFEKKKIAQDELDDLRHMIKKLQELVPTTEGEIDRHYYNCYGDGSVQVEKTGSVTVYIVRGENLGAYLHSAYGSSVKLPALKRDIAFHKVDVFSPTWTNKYGYPFVNTSLKGRGFEFGGDFTCLKVSDVYKSYGLIDRIEKGTIYVNNNDGKEVKLHVGACSRIESATPEPKKGQQIYYSGDKKGDREYNIYAASCF